MVSKVLDNVGEVMVLGGEEPPVEVRRLVEMLCDFNMTRDEVDIAMRAVVPEWEMGMATSCLRKYPLLAQTVAEGKALALRKAGADKVESIKCYVEAQGAVKEETGAADHDIRIKGSDRILTLMGESPIAVSRTEVAIDNRHINVDGETLAAFISAVERLDSSGYDTVDCDQSGER